MSQTIQNMDIDLQSMDEKHMQEFSLRENCSGVMGVPITFLEKYTLNGIYHKLNRGTNFRKEKRQ